MKGASSGNFSGNFSGVQADDSCVTGWNPQGSHQAEDKHDMGAGMRVCPRRRELPPPSRMGCGFHRNMYKKGVDGFTYEIPGNLKNRQTQVFRSNTPEDDSSCTIMEEVPEHGWVSKPFPWPTPKKVGVHELYLFWNTYFFRSPYLSESYFTYMSCRQLLYIMTFNGLFNQWLYSWHTCRTFSQFIWWHELAHFVCESNVSMMGRNLRKPADHSDRLVHYWLAAAHRQASISSSEEMMSAACPEAWSSVGVKGGDAQSWESPSWAREVDITIYIYVFFFLCVCVFSSVCTACIHTNMNLMYIHVYCRYVRTHTLNVFCLRGNAFKQPRGLAFRKKWGNLEAEKPYPVTGQPHQFPWDDRQFVGSHGWIAPQLHEGSLHPSDLKVRFLGNEKPKGWNRFVVIMGGSQKLWLEQIPPSSSTTGSCTRERTHAHIYIFIYIYTYTYTYIYIFPFTFIYIYTYTYTDTDTYIYIYIYTYTYTYTYITYVYINIYIHTYAMACGSPSLLFAS